jgi:hypothetical protein
MNLSFKKNIIFSKTFVQHIRNFNNSSPIVVFTFYCIIKEIVNIIMNIIK